MFNSYEYWDLRIETIRYCEQDVVTLYQILQKFQKKIFTLFRLDILKYPTLPSLAFAIYRSKFMGNAKIPLIDGNLFNQLKKGYTGGSVDVYKPYGVNIYRYDVNSLYPYVMREYPMPVGTPQYFEFSKFVTIEKLNHYIKNPFGFLEVEITTPENIERPLLQTRVKTKNGTRTIAPCGTWTDVVFSEEMFKCIKYGYKFKVLRGYLFERKNIFKEYINDLYKIKVSLSKDDPMYLISKLLMNSLYGRFGMYNNMPNYDIIPNIELDEYIDNINNNGSIIKEVIDLHNGKSLLVILNMSETQTLINQDISIGISSAVTAYARMSLSPFLTNKNL